MEVYEFCRHHAETHRTRTYYIYSYNSATCLWNVHNSVFVFRVERRFSVCRVMCRDVCRGVCCGVCRGRSMYVLCKDGTWQRFYCALGYALASTLKVWRVHNPVFLLIPESSVMPLGPSSEIVTRLKAAERPGVVVLKFICPHPFCTALHAPSFCVWSFLGQ